MSEFNSSNQFKTMTDTFTLKIKRLLNCTLVVVILIVLFHLTFILKGSFHVNGKERMMSEEFVWFNNTSTLLPTLTKWETAAHTYQREKITKICSQATDDLTLPRSRHFLVNHEHKLLYCWIHKVASTSWIAFFSHLAHRTHIEEYYREINILSPRNQEELEEVTRNKDYYKLMIVRHPFQRLVSAYRDRIEDTSRFTSQAWIYVPRIFSLTRPSLNVSHIFNTSHHQPTLSIVPSFEEFVQWLIMITPTKYDVHWNRYTDHCNPCAVHYNTVIKMDNFTYEEEISVLQEMGVQHLNVTLQHFQLTSGGPTDFNVSCHYFQQLLREQVEALYSIYRKDFEMFQYSVEPYINCARNHRSSDNTTVSNATTEDTK